MQGGLYPSVDLNADYGWEDRKTPVVDFGDYERDSIRFSVTQLLFDGFQTRDQARAFGYEELSQYYNFHGTAQQTALDATVAYTTTVLYQRLVTYAEDNYVYHRQVFNKIEERVLAGRDEGVNRDQATARLALAESNLLTEVTNLYDTYVEFQRIITRPAGEGLPKPSLPPGMLPSLREEALRVAYQNSPDVNRAIESLRSAREELNATRGPMYPRLDLRYRNQQESNINGFRGDYELQAVELLLTYNLYRGGTDSARRREYAARYYSAVEDRKDACLGVRQQVLIAFNNVRALEQQVEYLTLQLDAQDKTRRAYDDQFERQERTLLDLLDSQNEYFNTQRALAEAEARLVTAQATVLAETGVLTDALDTQGFNADKIEALELDLSQRDSEEIPPCATESIPKIAIDQDSIFDRLDAEAQASDAMP